MSTFSFRANKPSLSSIDLISSIALSSPDRVWLNGLLTHATTAVPLVLLFAYCMASLSPRLTAIMAPGPSVILLALAENKPRWYAPSMFSSNIHSRVAVSLT